MPKAGTKELTTADKLGIYIFLRSLAVDGKIPRGIISDGVKEFKCSGDGISRIKRVTKGITDASELLKLLKPKTSTRGRKKYCDEALETAIKKVPMNRRCTSRVLSRSCGIPKSSLHRALKRGQVLLSRYSRRRVRFSLSFVRRGAPDLPFSEMFDTVHIDEKWFYLTHVGKSYILMPGEKPPHRTARARGLLRRLCF